MSDIVIKDSKTFMCTPDKCLYNADDYKIYSCYVDSLKYPDIKIGKYGTATIKGDFQELNIGVEYSITGKEEQDKYGYGYVVFNIKRPKPNSLESSRKFLYEIITPNQANVLLEVYPDIVDRIINNKLDDIDLSKTHGIKEYIFEVIKRKVIENFKLADLVNEFGGLFSVSTLKRIYDKYPSIEKLKEKIKEEPYECLCGISRVGFKTADSMLLTIEKESKKLIAKGEKPMLSFQFDLKTSYQRMAACVLYILSQNEESGNTYMDVIELKKQCQTLAKDAIHHLAAVLKDGKDILLDRETLRVSFLETYKTEKYIAEKLIDGLQYNTKWDIDVEKYRKIEEFSLTDQQLSTLQSVCDNEITVLRGFSGTGKSNSSKALINLLKANNKSYLLLAPTGRASKVLSSYTGCPASTIHRGLGYSPTDGWIYTEENPIKTDIVIVDEFSMVDVFLLKHLVEAIDFKSTKLLIIGDDAQIPSVGAGNTLYDILSSKIVPTVSLKQVFRYGTGGLSTVATDIRKSKVYLDKENNSVQTFGEDKSYIFIPSQQENLIKKIVILYKKLLEQGNTPEEILVLSCYNKGDYGTDAINKQIQSAINKQKELVKYGETEFRKDDLVIQCVNDYKAIVYNGEYNPDNTTFIANGEIGKIKTILNNAIVVDFNGISIYYSKAAMKSLKLAYSISTHKSQGCQCRNVIFVSPKAHTYMLNSNLLYVGITRTKERCFHIGDITVTNRALKKKENYDRKTWLSDLLIKYAR